MNEGIQIPSHKDVAQLQSPKICGLLHSAGIYYAQLQLEVGQAPVSIALHGITTPLQAEQAIQAFSR
ncbi:MAG: hypothetical protein SFY81_16645 [Verrucomicrobiota bacterium]|nr:hypothetical protein [Verrucomicrobiota bacterium]